MQCSLDKRRVCFCYQEVGLSFWEQAALVPVLLVVPIPLEEAIQQEAAMHAVSVQELA